jgi:hypothetical protein
LLDDLGGAHDGSAVNIPAVYDAINNNDPADNFK